MIPNLVSTDWLAGRLGTAGLLVFDCSTYLPNEPNDAIAEFRAAHLPGARFFDLKAIADREADLPTMVPTPGRFAALVGALGIGNDSTVVFYDQKGLPSAARGWWMMGLFGHDQAAVLDGGLPKWVAEGRPVEAGDPPAAAPAHFRPDFRASRLRGIGDIQENLGTRRELVLDARAAARFAGTAPSRGPACGRATFPARQPAVHRPAGRRPHHAGPGRPARQAGRGRGGRQPAGRHLLRQRRLRLRAHAGHGAGRPGAGRGLRWLLGRMGPPPGHPGGNLRLGTSGLET